MKQAVQVTILGQQYTVKSETPPEEVRKVAAFVNEKISEVAATSKAVDTLNVAVLAFLNVAGAYFRLEQEVSASNKEIEERLRLMLARLERACPEATE